MTFDSWAQVEEGLNPTLRFISDHRDQICYPELLCNVSEMTCIFQRENKWQLFVVLAGSIFNLFVVG